MLPSRPYFQNSHLTKKKKRDGVKKKLIYIYIYIIFQGNNFIFLENINNKSSLKNKETRNSRGLCADVPTAPWCSCGSVAANKPSHKRIVNKRRCRQVHVKFLKRR